MRNECSNKEKEKKEKENAKKISKVTMENGWKSPKEFLDEFCFIVIDKEEEIDKDLQVTFEDI